MNCPKCGRPMTYLNQDYRTHGWYCQDAACKAWVKCDQYCCSVQTPVDRRNPECPPRPDMIWSVKHLMWVDRDTRSPETKARHEKIVADIEKRWKKEGS